MNKKGQVFTLDVLVAVGIFLATLMSSYIFWYDMISESVEEERYYEREVLIETASDLFVQTEGAPENWTLDSAWFIGAAEKPNLIDVDKFVYLAEEVGVNDSLSSTLSDENYEILKEKLGVPNYELYIIAVNLTTGSEINSLPRGAIGLYPNSSEDVSLRSRIVLFGNETANRTRISVQVYPK